MPARPLPPDLAAALERIARVEHAVVTRQQQLNAIRATTVLVHAARAAGWTLVDLAPALGIKLATLRRRVAQAPPEPGARWGLDIPPAPPRNAHVAPQLPVSQREWLTAAEARKLAGGISPLTLAQWRHAGLLPRTRTHAPVRGYLYSRTDLERIVAAPRTGRGVVRSAVLTSAQ